MKKKLVLLMFVSMLTVIQFVFPQQYGRGQGKRFAHWNCDEVEPGFGKRTFGPGWWKSFWYWDKEDTHIPHIPSNLKINTYEENNKFVIEVKIPGDFDGNDIKELKIAEDAFYILLEKTGKKEKEEKGKKYHRKEFPEQMARMERSISLDVKVHPETAKRELKDNILKIIVDKKESKKEGFVSIPKKERDLK